ncbi:hypothetical protein IPA_03205 [Ignicoccus pacificus DSM 13166]|uniref:Uncharacterized protein n=1 Tax=Ignicoccus pacificus DSM 13166 TaxID=940294 RepID=A0A977KAY0_9CREN|nr:hypothetical protein IPA_03205 [Ignicoccus pacificus DSM 13166]
MTSYNAKKVKSNVVACLKEIILEELSVDCNFCLDYNKKAIEALLVSKEFEEGCFNEDIRDIVYKTIGHYVKLSMPFIIHSEQFSRDKETGGIIPSIFFSNLLNVYLNLPSMSLGTLDGIIIIPFTEALLRWIISPK